MYIDKQGKLKTAKLPKACSYSYAKKLQKKFEKLGIETIVIKDKALPDSAIIDNQI